MGEGRVGGLDKGETDMADHGKRDSKREQKKKPKLTPKEKRALKKQKKA